MEDVLKIAGAFASIFAVYKVFIDIILAKSSKRREEYQFVKDYLDDLDEEESHPFLLEKGFFALTGDNYSVDEIKYLLSFSNPGKVIKLRSSSGKFLEFDREKQRYNWDGNCKKELVRKISSKCYIAGYIGFAFVALSPMYFKILGGWQNYVNIILSISLGVIAIASLSRHEDFKYSNRLMNEQDTSTNK